MKYTLDSVKAMFALQYAASDFDPLTQIRLMQIEKEIEKFLTAKPKAARLVFCYLVDIKMFAQVVSNVTIDTEGEGLLMKLGYFGEGARLVSWALRHRFSVVSDETSVLIKRTKCLI